ncbi:MAG TPA: sensor histidine kinase [Chloroflexi bacterium]|nr:sensor histidine kinase [Chloroflexota bacterium]
MPSDELNAQLENLFDDTVHQPETERADADESVEEKILDLLENKAAIQPPPPEPARLDTPPYSDETPIIQAEDVAIPLADAGFQELAAQAQKLSILIRGTMIVGSALLILLLIHLIWQWPTMTPQTSYVLYFGVGLAIFIATVLQWQGNASLNKALRQTPTQIPTPSSFSKQINRFVEANAQLQKRVCQLQAATQVSHHIAVANDLEVVMQTTVDAITDYFDFHHTGLFLIDVNENEDGQKQGAGMQWAILKAGSGEIGQKMLAQDHKIKVGSKSPVGWCASQGRAQAIPDPDNQLSRHDLDANPLLPDTRSELALPVKVQDRIIGVLDVHSSERQMFDQEIIELLQMIADQIAIAIGHARTPSEQVGEQERESKSEDTPLPIEEKVTLSSEQALTKYERTLTDLAPTSPAIEEKIKRAIQQAIEKQKIVVQAANANDAEASHDEAAILVSPIQLRGEAIGVLGLRETGKRYWTEDEIVLIETIADQMALAIENARLLRETQLRAERERLVSNISAKVRASTDVDSILRTAIRELGRALHASEGLINLSVETEDEVKAETDHKIELEELEELEDEEEQHRETTPPPHRAEQTDVSDPDAEVEHEMSTETSTEKTASV